MDPFNLIDYQKKARETYSLSKLYDLWQEVCILYEKRAIGNYQLEEMKEVIWASLKKLSSLKQRVDDAVFKQAS